MAGIDLRHKTIPTDILDALVQLALRAPAGKYVYDRDYSGDITDNRDHPSLTYGAGKDCDGWAQFFCQHFYAMREVDTAEVAAVTADAHVVAAAVVAHHRMLQYAGACMFFGRAVNPNKPGTKSFGHAWAGLLPPAAGTGPSHGRPAPTQILAAEPTAPLCDADSDKMTRVYTATTYPGAVDGVAFRGVRTILASYYPEVQTAISPFGSVKIRGRPCMSSTVLNAAQIATLCNTSAAAADTRIEWLLWPQTPMQMPPYYVAPAKVIDAAVGLERVIGADDSRKLGFSPMLAGGANGSSNAPVMWIAPNVCVEIITIAGGG